jgi:hypothetical protein
MNPASSPTSAQLGHHGAGHEPGQLDHHGAGLAPQHRAGASMTAPLAWLPAVLAKWSSANHSFITSDPLVSSRPAAYHRFVTTHVCDET